MDHLLQISITNWEKYNPRSDRANYTWFRFQNHFFHDQSVFPLSDSQKILFLFLLCEASRANSSEISIRLDYLSAILKVKPSEIHSNIQSIQDARLLAVITPADSRPIAGEEPSLLPATYVRTDVQTPVCLGPGDLQEIWNQHRGKLPVCRKLGDKRIRAAKIALASEPDPEYWTELIQALAASPWHTGETSSGWVADFDFLLQKDKHIELYDRLVGGKKSRAAAAQLGTSEDLKRLVNEFNGSSSEAEAKSHAS
jgi:hypothetical protein